MHAYATLCSTVCYPFAGRSERRTAPLLYAKSSSGRKHFEKGQPTRFLGHKPGRVRMRQGKFQFSRLKTLFPDGQIRTRKKTKAGETQEGGSNNRRHNDTIENRTRQHRHGGTATSANCRGIQAQRTNTMSMHENTTKANTRRTSPL